MANTQRNFVKGKMNKSVDERLVPNGEYTDALNVRLGSTEASEIGAVENSKGNTQLTYLEYDGVSLSNDARCIGVYEDGANETVYWFVHDPTYPTSPTGKIDLIVSYDTKSEILLYHIISVSKSGTTPTETVLNFDPSYLITGVDKVEDLLFFTDDYNAPRFINVTNNYANPSGTPLVDGGGDDVLLEESLLVIKRPPMEAPSILLTNTASRQENFLEERFISFAYRYKYENNEYSATSPFTDAAFESKAFNFDPTSSLNEGMVNNYNTAIITYNSGGLLVKSVDLLFKDSDGTIIKVIESLDKSDLGLADNTNYTYSFRNSKIFTILPQEELLRLYDNVPRFAKAQTLMGNRLMYGNYIEGYNLIDINNSPVRFEYSVEPISEEISLETLIDTFSDYDYNITVPHTGVDSKITVDLDGVELVSGAAFTIEMRFEGGDFTGAVTPTIGTPDTLIVFNYVLPTDFNSVYDLTTSVDFQEKIGLITNIEPVATACNGFTLTDIFNCAVPVSLDAGLWAQTDSGVATVPGPIIVEASITSTEISLILPATEWFDGVNTAYEYYSFSFADALYQGISNVKSLHSNRDYEVAIIYTDGFARATTALVSPNNSVHIPCSSAPLKNTLRVSIPPSQKPPFWATNYRFAIKPSKEKYETIYTNVFYNEPTTGFTWFLLEGENAQKVENGDRYIVKTDANGALRTCAYATVLEKEAQADDFIQPPPTDDVGNDIPVPAGTYMKMRASEFNLFSGAYPTVLPGKQSESEDIGGTYPMLFYRNLGLYDSVTGNYTQYDIPAGSRIVLTFNFTRRGVGNGNKQCERRIYNLESTLVASRDYDDIIEWWNGDNVASILNTGTQEVGGSGPPINNVYDTSLANQTLVPPIITPSLDTNYYQWYRDTITDEIQFIVSGTESCGGLFAAKKRRSTVEVEFEIFRATSTVVFETEPQEAQPDVWYEGSETFGIVQEGCRIVFTVGIGNLTPVIFDYTVNGQPKSVVVPVGQTVVYGDCGSGSVSPTTPPTGVTSITEATLLSPIHLGNIQNQSSSSEAIIDTSFFNCYSFGNGVESYKIRDSIVGKPLLLGNRVTTTSEEDYREVHRFADITYSGVYNDESNLNKLNQFNRGLLNFKSLEESFGTIQKLFARSTDVLTLQEDKISYVLAGKNLLSDAAVGGAIASIPEVLGTQIARLEEYGISFNPESFAVYGYDKYFSDQKRGAVIQLKGTSYSNESLIPISEFNMRSWFRDLFLDYPTTQKLGGYDPYMNEYVFSSNEIELPAEIPCLECGITQTVGYVSEELSFCYDVGGLVGDSTISIDASNVVGSIDFESTYNGVIQSLNVVANGNYSIVVDKDSVLIDELTLVITGAGTATLIITVDCPDADEIQIIQVCISNNANGGELIHNQYRWVDGSYTSPMHSEQVILSSDTTNPLISQYSSITGYQGTGVIPANGAQVDIISNRQMGDDFIFVDPPMNFKYLRTDTVYLNTPTAIANLLADVGLTTLAVDATLAPNWYQGIFTMPTTGNILYLMYDYRNPVLAELCYSDVDIEEVCCECEVATNVYATQCREDGVSVNKIVSQGSTNIGDLVELTGYGDCIFEITAVTEFPVTDSISAIRGDLSDCSDVCQEYSILNTDEGPITVQYKDCLGALQIIAIAVEETVNVCLTELVTSPTLFDIGLVDCVCETETYYLERCQSSLASSPQSYIAAATEGISIGDFVKVAADGSYCVYQVEESSELTPTTNITSVLEITDCNEVCNQYNVKNTTGVAGSYQYKQCGTGVVITVSLDAGEDGDICTTEFIEPFPTGFNVTFGDCCCDCG